MPFAINQHKPIFLAISLILTALSSPAYTADFTIADGEVNLTPQTLSANETGLIERGGQLNTTPLAIAAPGDNVTVTNKGSITTSGDFADGNFAYGIYSIGDDANITNSGSIITGGDFAYGIYSQGGANASITNSGNITTGGEDAYGIHSTGTNAIITNSGSIATVGRNAFGILSTAGTNANITNSGSITTGGDFADGIRSIGTNANITSSGSITTGGQEAVGIYSFRDNANIINSGSISTSGNGAAGIRSEGADTNITNSGNITTGGPVAYGIRSQDTNANITNSGSITTSGNSAYGILSQGTNVNITNSGSITTGGDFAHGIYSSKDNANITSSGSITTGGQAAYGIYSFSDNAAVSNQGSISTIGQDAYGIRSEGVNATINNSGSIRASGPGSAAIYSGAFASTEITLNLLPGSQIIGRIDLDDNGGDNDTANVYGGSASANLTFENTENINLFGAGVRSGKNVITVDTTGESTRGVALASMTSSIHNVIGQRMAHTTPLKPVRVASLALSPGMYFEEHKPVAWAQVFGGTFDRDAEGNALAYDHDHVGMNFGYEWDVKTARAGLMGGVVRSNTDTQQASFSTDADNYYVGAYGNRKISGFNITGSLLAGYGDHENDRLVVDNLNGFEKAKSDLDSFFISPSLTIASAYTVDERLELRPSATVAYSIAWLDSYTESGTTNSNLSVDGRKAKAFTARLQMAAAYALSDHSEFELRVGMNSRHTHDEDTRVSIAGSNFKFATAGDENVTSGFAGASLRVAHNDNLSLIADMEFGGDSDESYAVSNISLEYLF